MTTLTPEQLHVLQHSLGADKHGETAYRGRDEGDGKWWFHRNHYAGDATPLLDGLVAAGLMRDAGAINAWGGMRCYRVTLAGRDVMLAQSPKPPVLTRGQQRYRDYLRADSGETFHEWLQRRESNRKAGRRETAYA